MKNEEGNLHLPQWKNHSLPVARYEDLTFLVWTVLRISIYTHTTERDGRRGGGRKGPGHGPSSGLIQHTRCLSLKGDVQGPKSYPTHPPPSPSLFNLRVETQHGRLGLKSLLFRLQTCK